MEILIPGLILVALMAWASTKIKKRAADAFEPESVETEDYFVRKPEGFLHVIGSRSHEFEAYSREFSAGDDSQTRRATIEIDVLPDPSLAEARERINKTAPDLEVRREGPGLCEIIATETANQTPVTAFYKIMAAGNKVVRLRFGVVTEHRGEFEQRIDETLDSFIVRSN
jgi:hypothetical protein